LTTPLPKAKYFKTAAAFRRWLARHHDSADELIVGYYKVKTGKPGMTWSESVDEERYCIRFTPRRSTSIWSKVNLDKVKRLKKADRMQPAGLAAYAKRKASRSKVYGYEKVPAKLSAAYTRRLEEDPDVWAFFSAQAPWYRRKVTHWIMSAKQEKTRLRRLQNLIDHCTAECTEKK